MEYLQKHWVEIGIWWLLVQNFLKAIQDTLDAMPKDAPPIRKVVFFMSGVGGYLFAGNRPEKG